MTHALVQTYKSIHRIDYTVRPKVKAIKLQWNFEQKAGNKSCFGHNIAGGVGEWGNEGMNPKPVKKLS